MRITPVWIPVLFIAKIPIINWFRFRHGSRSKSLHKLKELLATKGENEFFYSFSLATALGLLPQWKDMREVELRKKQIEYYGSWTTLTSSYRDYSFASAEEVDQAIEFLFRLGLLTSTQGAKYTKWIKKLEQGEERSRIPKTSPSWIERHETIEYWKGKEMWLPVPTPFPIIDRFTGHGTSSFTIGEHAFEPMSENTGGINPDFPFITRVSVNRAPPSTRARSATLRATRKRSGEPANTVRFFIGQSKRKASEP